MKQIVRKRSKSKFIIIAAALLVLAGLGAFVWHKHSDDKQSVNNTADTIGTDSKKPAVYNADPDVPGGSTGDTEPQPVGEAVAPTGTFISNHHPNLSGAPAPSTINSVCRTSPETKCVIRFTKDGIIKTLPEKTADKDGTVIWDWKLQDVGLTAGSWKVEAVATLGTSTPKVTADDLMLEVAQ